MVKEEKQKTWWEKIKQNHGLMMVLCCGIPLIVLLIAVYAFGVSRSYLFWFVLLLCPLMHFFMMKDMHKGHAEHKEDQGKEGKTKGGGCH